MYKWFTSLVVVFAGILLAGWTSLAGNDTPVAVAANTSTQKLAAVETGRAAGPVSTLTQAADRGDLDAQLELAGMYAAGTKVPASQLKAFNLFQRIVETHAEIHPRDIRAGRVATAFVALGDYFRTGISGTPIKANKRRAASLYWHAASYLGNAEAQCNLALMYLNGDGVPRNGRLAVNWLTNAAKKRSARAQAILGDLLWRGAEDVRRQPMKGLALLAIAGQNARDDAQARWIETLRGKALANAQAHEQAGAKRLSALWQSSIGRPSAAAVASAPAVPAAEPDLPVSDAPLQNTPAAGFTNIGLHAGDLPQPR